MASITKKEEKKEIFGPFLSLPPSVQKKSLELLSHFQHFSSELLHAMIAVCVSLHHPTTTHPHSPLLRIRQRHFHDGEHLQRFEFDRRDAAVEFCLNLSRAERIDPGREEERKLTQGTAVGRGGEIGCSVCFHHHSVVICWQRHLYKIGGFVRGLSGE